MPETRGKTQPDTLYEKGNSGLEQKLSLFIDHHLVLFQPFSFQVDTACRETNSRTLMTAVEFTHHPTSRQPKLCYGVTSQYDVPQHRGYDWNLIACVAIWRCSRLLFQLSVAVGVASLPRSQRRVAASLLMVPL